MRIVIINGQEHSGSTRWIARTLAERIGGEITEFFLPRDFGEFCSGCTLCFLTDLKQCPNYPQLQPLIAAMDSAELIILDSPVYALHVSGQMKSFLDHLCTRWLVHRPVPVYFHKQAVSIATAAGGGMRRTVRDMADSLRFWGIPKVYHMGFGVQAIKPEEIPERIRKRILKQIERVAARILRHQDPPNPSLHSRFWIGCIRFAHLHFPPLQADFDYWQQRGWHDKNRPWKKNPANEK